MQGAFIEHMQALRALGVPCVELRQKSDAEQALTGLILPGGESTVQGKLLRDLDMYAVLKEKIQRGMPVLGTCAGMILLAQRLSNDDKTHFVTMPITVKRNAYGRQLGSFHTQADFAGLGSVPMTFIRAPYIERIGAGVQTLAEIDGHIVAARYGKQLALAFHPELDLDKSMAIHRYFVSLCAE